ncbi:MAG TPA: GAF domain-containing sensor histidine kinase [Thermoanaerobaculia bacterium]|jgi:signal transduction histidine kinase
MDAHFQTQIREFLDSQPSALVVWARWSLSTREEGEWQHLFRKNVQPMGDLTAPPVEIPAVLFQSVTRKVENSPVKVIESAPTGETILSGATIGSVVIAPLIPRVAQVVVVGFADMAEAQQRLHAVDQLAKRLLQEIKEHRRAQETESLLGVATAPAHLEIAGKGLQDMAREVARCLGADGAKIYLVSRSPSGPVLWRAANTGHEINPRRVPFSPDRGLADYVVGEKTWLLIPRCGLVDESEPEKGIRQEGRNGRGEPVVVYARPGKETDPDAPKEKTDDEHSILTYPLETDDQITGAVFVWRLRPEAGQPEPPPFDEDLDVASLANFARHLAAACQRMMQLLKAEQHLEETAALAQRLASAQRLKEGYEAVAAGACRLADAACAVLFHYEPKGDAGGSLYQSALWQMEGLDPALPEQPFLEECEADPKAWEAVVRRGLGERLKSMVFRKLLIEHPTEPQSGAPAVALALLEPPLPEKSPPYFSDELLEHFASAFFQAAVLSLRSHVRDLASHLLDRLAGPPLLERQAPLDPEELLDQAAHILSEATGADQVLVYTGPAHHLQVRQSFPPAPQLADFQVSAKSKTAQIAAQKTSHRVLAVSKASRELDNEVLSQITKKLVWPSVRSWLAYPLLHEKRVLGLFKLLTREIGDFLGQDHEEITQQVVRHCAWEMYKAARQQALEELLALINKKIGDAHGNQLGEAIVELLKEWAGKVLFHPNARALILARSEQSGTLVKAGAEKDTLDILERTLDTIVQRFHSGKNRWDKNESSDLSQFAPYGIGEAFSSIGDKRFRGIICLGDDEAFDQEDQETLREASRLLSVVLNVERERNDLKVVMGRFRHAALGPIQGMQSVAQALVEIAKNAGTDEAELTQLKSSVAKEAELLRLWRENQRFYLTDEIKLVRRPIPLRPLVERCFARYKDIVKERDVSYKLQWKPAGELRLHLDNAAFDVALSNLLDNAAKYVFNGQYIEVGVEVVQAMVDLWVEDVGHGIDPKAVDRIFRLQERANRDDPFRMISGQGLGLAMASRIVEAHDGVLTVKAEHYISGKQESTTSHRVRFNIRLPFSPLR